MELLVTRLSSVHKWKEFSGISGCFGGLSVSSFCSAATISLLVVEKTRSSNKAVKGSPGVIIFVVVHQSLFFLGQPPAAASSALGLSSSVFMELLVTR